MRQAMKVRLMTLLFSLLAFSTSLQAQESEENQIKQLFLDQLSLFPQEKIYVHTDKSSYQTGEMIWLRVHMVDAVFLKQANASRYVYIELIDPVNRVVDRVKLRPDTAGCFYGYIQLDKELGMGTYHLRAYTRFMQNIGEDYFFTKPVYVTNPGAEKISVDIKYRQEGKSVSARLKFCSQAGRDTILPDQCAVLHAASTDEDAKEVRFDKRTGYCSWSAAELNRGRTFLLKTVAGRRTYKQYFTIPYLEKSFDVSFFPEGGYAPVFTNITMAFKSVNTSGLSEYVKGKVYDDQNQECAEFECSHQGMGRFNMHYEPGKKYYAVCTNKDSISKRFDLPLPSDSAVSLKTEWEGDKLFVSVLKSPNYRLLKHIQLVAHIRGVPVYAKYWNEEKEHLVFEKDFFPAGIVHFLLIDEDRNILSERLVFSFQKNTFAQAAIEPDKKTFKSRDKISLSIRVTDKNQDPLPGYYSLAVLDAGNAALDTTSTIVSTLLLSSELKGNIENPMFYFQKDNKKATAALDMLLMTQGWRRYDIPKLLKGSFQKELRYPVELREELTGKSDGVFSSSKDAPITLIALNDSVIGSSYVQTDQKGRFAFSDLEYPEGTKYVVQANSKKGSRRVFIEIDSVKPFPSLKSFPVDVFPSVKVNNTSTVGQNGKLLPDEGMKTIDLNEITVTAKRKPLSQTDSPYYSVMSSSVITSKDIDKWHILSVYDLLRRLSGVTVSGSEVRYRGNTPMLLLDNIPMEGFDYDMLMVDDIKDAFVTPGTSMGIIFGSRGANGAIVINTKKGFVQTKTMSSNIRYVNALGYQQPVKFYSPVYDTEDARKNPRFDSRTTIYWNPVVRTDKDGMAQINFYSADSSSKYIVVLEGVSNYGHLVSFMKENVTVAAGH